ncbi:MAG: hypothetical protein HC811_05175 [Flammeovirgaceae bacterium]|nr:hypothetical protein [Flammeovirgaceae bacterium]
MRRYLLILVALVAGCTESNLELGAPATFVRSFNGGANDEAQMVQETPDKGFIILGTTEFFDAANSTTYYKIKLIKTDEFGNTEWQKSYPPYPFDAASPPQSWRGSAVHIIKDGAGAVSGYAIVGDSVEQGKTIDLAGSGMLVMTTDALGVQTQSTVINHSSSILGKAITQGANGNLLVLGTSTTSLTENMLLSELAISDLSTVWTRPYGNGQTVLANKLFTSSQSSIFWSGSVDYNNNSDIRLVKTFPDEAGTEFDLQIGDPILNETGNDICRYGAGFAVIGTTTTTAGDNDIQFTLINDDGNILSQERYGVENQDDFGYSICGTQDGGVVMIGAIETADGKDYYLIKINAFGDETFPAIAFGSRNDDVAASIIQASDGGYVILGTTIMGGLQTIMLMKTNLEGKIE